LEDARRVCAKLQMPLYVVDFKDEFKKRIVDVFIDELKSGFTPNACVVCNRDVKFGLLMDYAVSIGVDYVATGHYAQIFYDNDSARFGIKKAVDDTKDQSYFLALLSQDQLKRVLLPLGGLTKDYVRQIARDHGLVNSKRRDSQDLCFVASDYRSFVKKYTEQKSGNIVLRNGEIIGKHEGLIFYTVGQRKGVETKLNVPLFVYEKDFDNNDLIVDFTTRVDKDIIKLKEFNFLSESYFVGDGYVFVGRYQGTGLPIKNIENKDSAVSVRLNESGPAFSGGQFGAIYRGTTLIGAGKIYL
jgi:tRNA-specific 2-thiouridylase